ncbi:MAG TPA: hypothetical protein VH234_00460 [Candidatus Saccharimonadales bacterium]|jgi:hypothetical protein|nr:hypothetical protein [Candidatus Saccharimonadales bacterium]
MPTPGETVSDRGLEQSLTQRYTPDGAHIILRWGRATPTKPDTYVKKAIAPTVGPDNAIEGIKASTMGNAAANLGLLSMTAKMETPDTDDAETDAAHPTGEEAPEDIKQSISIAGMTLDAFVHVRETFFNKALVNPVDPEDPDSDPEGLRASVYPGSDGDSFAEVTALLARLTGMREAQSEVDEVRDPGSKARDAFAKKVEGEDDDSIFSLFDAVATLIDEGVIKNEDQLMIAYWEMGAAKVVHGLLVEFDNGTRSLPERLARIKANNHVGIYERFLDALKERDGGFDFLTPRLEEAIREQAELEKISLLITKEHRAKQDGHTTRALEMRRQAWRIIIQTRRHWYYNSEDDSSSSGVSFNVTDPNVLDRQPVLERKPDDIVPEEARKILADADAENNKKWEHIYAALQLEAHVLSDVEERPSIVEWVKDATGKWKARQNPTDL